MPQGPDESGFFGVLFVFFHCYVQSAGREEEFVLTHSAWQEGNCSHIVSMVRRRRVVSVLASFLSLMEAGS